MNVEKGPFKRFLTFFTNAIMFVIIKLVYKENLQKWLVLFKKANVASVRVFLGFIGSHLFLL